MERESIISQLYDKDRIFDFVVIGGGATGLGVRLRSRRPDPDGPRWTWR